MFSYYAWLYTLKTPISLLLKLGTTKSSHFLTKVGQLWATNAAWQGWGTLGKATGYW
jgi:hypothetical protein